VTNSKIAGPISVVNGGTGLNNIGSPNQILQVNSAGTALEYVSSSSGAGQEGDLVHTLSKTIGDYSNPTGATASSQITEELSVNPASASPNNNGNDGDYGTGSCLSAQNNSGYATIYTWDNQSIVFLETVRIKSYARAYGQVQAEGNLRYDYSTDGVNWTTITTKSIVYNGGSGNTWDDTFTLNTNVGYIRVLSKINNVSWVYDVCVYDTTWSFNDTSSASRTFDNNISKRWQSSNENKPWIRLDLGANKDIASLAVNLDRTNTNATSLKIYSSTDTSFSSNEVIAYINVSDFTDDTYRYVLPNFLEDRRYIMIEAQENSCILAINEAKVRHTLTDWDRKHFHAKRTVDSISGFNDSN
jgi:hypothetical protein